MDAPRSGERQRADPATKGYLPRLSPEHYRGHAFVHWTLTLEKRATGWLTPGFHVTWREVLLHACARHGLLCPVYVLMPDHVHLLWAGVTEHADQRMAATFLRKHLRAALAPHDWQKQPHDHLLRAEEREQPAFIATAEYLMQNPVRAGLAPRPQDYPYLGCCVIGYPDLRIGAEDYWERYWRVYNYVVSQKA